MDPVVVKTVSKKRVSVENRIVAFGAVIKLSFRQEISRRVRTIGIISGSALFINLFFGTGWPSGTILSSSFSNGRANIILSPGMDFFFAAATIAASLLEQVLVNLFDPAHRQDLDIELLIQQTFQVVLADDDLFKAQLFGFGYALFDPVDPSDLAA